MAFAALSSPTQTAAPPSGGRTYRGPLITLTSLFFIWGFLTSLNDILIPHLRSVFTLGYAQAMLVQFCFFAAYLLVSVPAGWLVERIGYQRGIVVGLAVAGAGCLLFHPAAGLASYAFFLGALFILASGITLLQVAANPYVAVLGPVETASSRLTLTQAFNSLGTTLAPFFGSFMILSVALKPADELARLPAAEQAAYAAAQAGAVQIPYLGLTAVLFLVAVVMACSRLPVIESVEGQPDAAAAATAATSGGRGSVWHHRHLVLGAGAIFLYVGAEVSIGSFLVNFMAQPQVAGLSLDEAANYLALYWGGSMVGRFVGAALLKRVRPGRLLAFNALVAVALLALAMTLSGRPAMAALLAVGLFNSIMFPTIFTLAIEGLGHHTGEGSGVLCMAIVGGAIVPLLQGLLADHLGLGVSFVVPALCYLYVAFYGVKGHVAAP